jgi:hypothetical protein
MPRGRNFTRQSYRNASSRAGTIASITIVTPDKGHPFVCPVCRERDDEKEYLRIYLKKIPTSLCVHSKCLVEMLHKRKERTLEVMYARNTEHGRHEGMRATGMRDE